MGVEALAGWACRRARTAGSPARRLRRRALLVPLTSRAAAQWPPRAPPAPSAALQAAQLAVCTRARAAAGAGQSLAICCHAPWAAACATTTLIDREALGRLSWRAAVKGAPESRRSPVCNSAMLCCVCRGWEQEGYTMQVSAIRPMACLGARCRSPHPSNPWPGPRQNVECGEMQGAPGRALPALDFTSSASILTALPPQALHDTVHAQRAADHQPSRVKKRLGAAQWLGTSHSSLPPTLLTVAGPGMFPGRCSTCFSCWDAWLEVSTQSSTGGPSGPLGRRAWQKSARRLQWSRHRRAERPPSLGLAVA